MESQVTTSRPQSFGHLVEGREEIQPAQDLIEYLKAYARARPEVAALWCFGIGFVVGWKLKPW